MAAKTSMESGHMAIARRRNLSISTKHCVEIGKVLRNRSTAFAKKFLDDVIQGKKAVPFTSFYLNVGHKRGMAAGRFPQKAAQEFVHLVRSAEANAQFKGLNTASLKIVRLIANRASIPISGGRQRYGTKRTHLEIAVAETSPSSSGKSGSKSALKGTSVKAVTSEKTPEKSVKVDTTMGPTKVEARTQLSTPSVMKNVPEAKEAQKKVPLKIEASVNSMGSVKSAEVSPIKVNTPVQGTPVQVRMSETSSVDLLKQAQMKAAELNTQQQRRKEAQREVSQVGELFEQLKKQGTLRSTRGTL